MRFATDRRTFLRIGTQSVIAVGVPTLFSACAPIAARPLGEIDLEARLGTSGARDRDHPHYLNSKSDFHGHTMDGGQNTGGIDYGPIASVGDTEICPVAAGIVIGHRDDAGSSGMVLIVAHGLGWKSLYAHLGARFVQYRDQVRRRDIIATMGREGLRSSRALPTHTPVHLHLTVYGPAYTPLFHESRVQHRPENRPPYRNVLDPEKFSLAGWDRQLPFSRDEDSEHDSDFMSGHRAAVVFCDQLLEQLEDEKSKQAKERERWETEGQFDYNVDQRIWFLWQRLQGGEHPFSDVEVQDYRTKLRGYMVILPRFTAPIVEPARRAEYRILRGTPLKVSTH